MRIERDAAVVFNRCTVEMRCIPMSLLVSASRESSSNKNRFFLHFIVINGVLCFMQGEHLSLFLSIALRCVIDAVQ